MTNPDIYIKVFEYALTLSITMLGVSVSIFTLTISFIVSKRDTLNEFSNQIKQGGPSLSLTRKAQIARNFICNMKKITNLSIVTIVSSFISIIGCIIFNQLQPNYYSCIIIAIVLFAVVTFIVCLCKLFKWYLKK